MDIQSPSNQPPRGEQTMSPTGRGARSGRGQVIPQLSPFSRANEDENSCSQGSLTLTKQMSSVAQKLSSSIGSLGARGRSSLESRRRHHERSSDEEEEREMEQDVGGAESRHAEAGTAMRSHLLQRAIQKDLDPLTILVFDQHQSHVRRRMNRFELLSECRESVLSPQVSAQGREDKQFMSSSLQLRDLRILQGVRGPAIFVRRGAMVISLDPVQAVITREKCFVVVPEDNPEQLMRSLLTRVQAAASVDSHQGGLPFELVAVEALMVTAVKHKRSQVDECMSMAKRILRSIRKNMSVSLLNRILTVKKSIDELYQSVHGAQEAIEEVQNDDDAMMQMFLTAIHRDPGLVGKMQEQSATQSHRLHLMEVEVLLDAYALEFEGLANELSSLDKDIDATEDLLKFKLDKARNRLIRIDVAFGMIGAWLGACTTVAGFFGMNLPYGAYTDGTVDQPPTSGTHYDGPWAGGPSWEFFEVGITSVGGTVVLILLTCVSYCLYGAVRVWMVRRRLKRKERSLQALEGARG